MTDFNRKVEEASARVNKSVGEAAERVEKETAESIKYLNNEVVPAVRQHSTKALRIASEKLAPMAKYRAEHQKQQKELRGVLRFSPSLSCLPPVAAPARRCSTRH